jgi:quinol monooxygenase YgiN
MISSLIEKILSNRTKLSLCRQHSGEMLEQGVMTMTGAKVCASKDSIETIKPTADKFGMEYYEEHGHVTSIKSAAGSDDKPYDFSMLMVRFKINNWDKFCDQSKVLYEKVAKEDGCLFYGLYHKNEATLEVRELYRDGTAVNAHLENVGQDLGQLLETRTVELEHGRAHGPEEELEISKEALASFGFAYLPQMDKGFSRFSSVA